MLSASRNSLLILLLLAFSLTGKAQVIIEGEVIHDRKPLSDVTLQLLEKDKVIRTLIANKRGQYEIDLPFGHRYVLVFRKPYMVPVSIEVNTNMKTESSVEEIVVPLNMELVYRFEKIENQVVTASVGEILQQGEGTNTFGFLPNKEALAAVKAYNDESYALEQNGEQPILSSRNKAPAEIEERVETDDVKIAENDPIISNDETDATNELSIERKVSGYDVAAQSKQIETESKQQLDQDAEMSGETRATTADSFIYSRKRSVSEMEANRIEDKNAQNEALVRKYAGLERELISQAQQPKSSIGKSYRPAALVNDPGWFVSEQRFSLEEDGMDVTYSRVTFHLVVTDIRYYYKDSKEISEREYQRAAREIEN